MENDKRDTADDGEYMAYDDGDIANDDQETPMEDHEKEVVESAKLTVDEQDQEDSDSSSSMDLDYPEEVRMWAATVVVPGVGRDAEFGASGDSGSMVYAKVGDTTVPIGIHIGGHRAEYQHTYYREALVLCMEAFSVVAERHGFEVGLY
ncbi:hypothetical protein CC80DRAFT_549308 [Byssothecium circinans]|uniref:Uncharacterized protein n=1 Tax=Byssothecium circinans TaxID=147558 RepID=A0A6A5TT85_9PLEO|nr:hypothetical protein CC80DRAFT_549308 [Byssothecium circinans]